MLAEEQERNNQGLAINKERVRDLLIDTMQIVGTQVKSWAAVNQEDALFAQIETSKAKLRRQGFKLTEKATALEALAAERLTELADYGVTQAWLDELTARAEAYEEMVVAPRSAIAQRKTLTAMITREVKELRRFMREVIDTMLRQFGRTEPQFYLDYKNARRIVRTGSRSRQSDDEVVSETASSRVTEANVVEETERVTASEEEGQALELSH